jgi:uncharacterized protein (DUF302 family)
MTTPTDPWYGEPAYTLTRHFPGADHAATVAATRAALATEGFGVLTEIDVRATFDKKLGVEFPPYVILGACNPPLALKALTSEPGIGTLLPCNVVVADNGSGATVSAIDPIQMLSVVGRPGLEEFADEVRARLLRVIERVAP